MREKHTVSPPAVGGSALLVIFAVLCLTVFALLSLATVQADRRTADAAVQAVSDYYSADCAAESVLAELRGGKVPDGVQMKGDHAAYACTISDTQELQVEVRVDGTAYTILKWQAVSTADWQAQDHINVWNGGTGE